MLKLISFLGFYYLVIGIGSSRVCLAQDEKNTHIDDIRKSLFKIRVRSQALDYRKPWKFLNMKNSSGSGFYIGKNRILTNAHVVSNAKFITVQRDGSSKPVIGFVQHIAHDADLAIISVANKDFFSGIKPLILKGVPKLNSFVMTVGYPTGGEQISITRGVVSRISNRSYVHSGLSSHLLLQVDSAINHGNSGGPVLQDGMVIGVAFQSFRSAENTGYVIPVPVIKRFLQDITDGSYDEHPYDGINYNKWVLNNQATISYHKLGSPKGVKVVSIEPGTSALSYLHEGDILLRIGDYEIGVDGRINLYNERINFNTIFDLLQIGEKVNFVISRLGKIRSVDFTIKKNAYPQFSSYRYRRSSRYAIFSGLVFIPLTSDSLRMWGRNWSRSVPSLYKYLFHYGRFDPDFKNVKEFVILSEILPHEINTSYMKHKLSVVLSVNKKKINSFEDMVKNIDQSKKDLIRLDFIGERDSLYLSKKEILRDTQKILDQYGVKESRNLKDGLDGAIQKGDL